jgi:hypothetical protein
MKNKLIIVGSILVAFVVGVVCANVFQARPASAKSGRVEIVFEKMKVKGLHALERNMWRSNVPGGWIVTGSAGAAFVPDPNHQWQ